MQDTSTPTKSNPSPSSGRVYGLEGSSHLSPGARVANLVSQIGSALPSPRRPTLVKQRVFSPHVPALSLTIIRCFQEILEGIICRGLEPSTFRPKSVKLYQLPHGGAAAPNRVGNLPQALVEDSSPIHIVDTGKTNLVPC